MDPLHNVKTLQTNRWIYPISYTPDCKQTLPPLQGGAGASRWLDLSFDASRSATSEEAALFHGTLGDDVKGELQ